MIFIDLRGFFALRSVRWTHWGHDIFSGWFRKKPHDARGMPIERSQRFDAVAQKNLEALVKPRVCLSFIFFFSPLIGEAALQLTSNVRYSLQPWCVSSWINASIFVLTQETWGRLAETDWGGPADLVFITLLYTVNHQTLLHVWWFQIPSKMAQLLCHFSEAACCYTAAVITGTSSCNTCSISEWRY